MFEFRQYLPHLSVFLVGLCLYVGTVTHQHVLDDLELIPHQPAIRNPWNVRAILFGRYWETLREQDILYRPFTIWTLGVNYWVNEVVGVEGTHPAIYRMSNALLHALVSGLTCAFFCDWVLVSKSPGSGLFYLLCIPFTQRSWLPR